VRKGVEQHVVLVQDGTYFYSLVFFCYFANHDRHIEEQGARCIYYGRPHPPRHARTHQLEVHDDLLALVSSTIPSFDGNFDPRAYIEWELKVEKEFDEHDLSEAQMIYIASHALTEYALIEWKHICRNNNIPQYWRDFKLLFREALEKHLFLHSMSIICLQN
jgi:hypothetical protein